ncbi:hypothetical protein [Thiocapsa bogorovii]|uniref:hypothetical protein n=1 Tax=Thiocapsa bogorovii TaxID=521689 RepID=UPI001E39DF65|nr:hypothetical protein [Thiocapsa bogorovii]UHD18399.1 hypothetical protein LT988_10340 [Thiocapsa bogorovii]
MKTNRATYTVAESVAGALSRGETEPSGADAEERAGDRQRSELRDAFDLALAGMRIHVGNAIDGEAGINSARRCPPDEIRLDICGHFGISAESS